MELQQRSLIRLSLVGFLVCFILIYYIDNSFELDSTKIDLLTLKDIDKIVKINGDIVSSRVLNNNVFFEIKQNNETLGGIMFYQNKSLELNRNYSIIGKVSSYRGKVEVIAQEIIEN